LAIVQSNEAAVVQAALTSAWVDLQPPTFTSYDIAREQLMLDRKDDRVRACEDELRALATERRRYGGDLRDLADALDSTWQAYAFLIWHFTLPQDNPLKKESPDLMGYLDKHGALGVRVAKLRGRLESWLP
jgi:hypothetical protein